MEKEKEVHKSRRVTLRFSKRKAGAITMLLKVSIV